MIERRDITKLDLVKTVETLKRDGVSCDIDGVEAATAFLSLREYNLLHGYKKGNPKVMDDVKEYGIMINWFREDPEIVDPAEEAVSIWNSRQVIENAQRVEGFLSFAQFLSGKGISPYRITSRPGYTYEWTKSWYLSKYGPNFDLNLIRMQRDINSITNPDFKAQEIKKLGIGYHFEDSFENAELIVAKSDATVVIVPQPWNMNYEPTHPRILITEGFQHRMKMISAFLTLAEHITYQ